MALAAATEHAPAILAPGEPIFKSESLGSVKPDARLEVATSAGGFASGAEEPDAPQAAAQSGADSGADVALGPRSEPYRFEHRESIRAHPPKATEESAPETFSLFSGLGPTAQVASAGLPPTQSTDALAHHRPASTSLFGSEAVANLEDRYRSPSTTDIARPPLFGGLGARSGSALFGAGDDGVAGRAGLGTAGSTAAPTEAASRLSDDPPPQELRGAHDDAASVWSVHSGALDPGMQAAKRADFGDLERHIAELTEERFALQRALAASAERQAEVASEQEGVVAACNAQAARVEALQAELEALHVQLAEAMDREESVARHRDALAHAAAAADERAQVMLALLAGWGDDVRSMCQEDYMVSCVSDLPLSLCRTWPGRWWRWRKGCSSSRPPRSGDSTRTMGRRPAKRRRPSWPASR